MLWITIWSMVSTLEAKCGTRVIILPHYYSLLVKKSFASSGYFCQVFLMEDLPSLTVTLSLSYYESSFLEIEAFLPFLEEEGEGSGLMSMSSMISCQFLWPVFNLFLISARMILKISYRKEVVLQKSQNQWQKRSLKFSQELGLAIFFSPFIRAAFSDRMSTLRGYSFQKADLRGASSSRMARTTGLMFSTSSMSCWLVRHSLAKISSILALLSRQNLLYITQNSLQDTTTPSCFCLFCTVLSNFSTAEHFKLATYSSTNPAMRSKFISRRMCISSSGSFWNSQSLLLNLLISLMQQWSMRCVRSAGISMSSPARNYSMRSQILRRGSLKMSQQGRGGMMWKPVGFQFNFLRYMSVSLTRQYQQRLVLKKILSRSSCMFLPLNPLHPHSRWNSQNRLCVVRSSFKLYWKFLMKIWATFLQPVRMMNHSSTNSSKGTSPSRCLTMSQSKRILSMVRTLMRLPVMSLLKEKGVITFCRNWRVMPPAALPQESEPLPSEIMNTWALASTFMGMFFFQSPICYFSLPTSSNRASFSPFTFAASSSSPAIFFSSFLCFSSWKAMMLTSRSWRISVCAFSFISQSLSQSTCRATKLLLRVSISWYLVFSVSREDSCAFSFRISFWQMAKYPSTSSTNWRLGLSFSQTSDLREFLLTVNSSRQRLILSFILLLEYANLGSQIYRSFFSSYSRVVYWMSSRYSGIFLIISGMMVSRSLKALADSLKRMLAMPRRSSVLSSWYSFSRNQSIRSLSQLPR